MSDVLAAAGFSMEDCDGLMGTPLSSANQAGGLASDLPKAPEGPITALGAKPDLRLPHCDPVLAPRPRGAAEDRDMSGPPDERGGQAALNQNGAGR